MLTRLPSISSTSGCLDRKWWIKLSPRPNVLLHMEQRCWTIALLCAGAFAPGCRAATWRFRRQFSTKPILHTWHEYGLAAAELCVKEMCLSNCHLCGKVLAQSEHECDSDVALPDVTLPDVALPDAAFPDLCALKMCRFKFHL